MDSLVMAPSNLYESCLKQSWPFGIEIFMKYFRMAAYNRRWYILSSIIGALGIGLIGALLGMEEFIVMDITDDDSTNSTCNFDVSTRKLGFFTGTDKTCTVAGEKLAEHWPMLCMGKSYWVSAVIAHTNF